MSDNDDDSANLNTVYGNCTCAHIPSAFRSTSMKLMHHKNIFNARQMYTDFPYSLFTIFWDSIESVIVYLKRDYKNTKEQRGVQNMKYSNPSGENPMLLLSIKCWPTTALLGFEQMKREHAPSNCPASLFFSLRRSDHMTATLAHHFLLSCEEYQRNTVHSIGRRKKRHSKASACGVSFKLRCEWKTG